MKVVTEDSGVSASSTLSDVPGMSLTMAVPAGEKGLFLATFSADVYAINAGCWLQMLISGTNGGVMAPGQVLFQDHGSNASSMQFLAGPYPAGQYTMKVQWYVLGPGSCGMAGRTLSILRSKV
jgi:hypothetical protein